jgi:molecular chaperone GrpE
MQAEQPEAAAEMADSRPDGTGTAPDAASPAAELEEERAKSQGYYASWQRAVADFQNYKRRVEEQRANDQRLHNLSFVLNILPAIDDLERALASVDTTLAGLQWVEGIRQIHRKLEGALQASSVQEVPADGVDFDPNVHEAVSQEAGEEGKVVRVLQKGYTMGDRLIRPAMVMVGRGTEE